MDLWQLRLAHEKVVKDCHIKAGNIPKPKESEPVYGVNFYEVYRFNGAAFFTALNEASHDKAEFKHCKCFLNERFGQ